jgi:hypothetical protein
MSSKRNDNQISKQVQKALKREPCKSRPNGLACEKKLKKALRQVPKYKEQGKISQRQNINIRIGDLAPLRRKLAKKVRKGDSRARMRSKAEIANQMSGYGLVQPQTRQRNITTFPVNIPTQTTTTAQIPTPTQPLGRNATVGTATQVAQAPIRTPNPRPAVAVAPPRQSFLRRGLNRIFSGSSAGSSAGGSPRERVPYLPRGTATLANTAQRVRARNETERFNAGTFAGLSIPELDERLISVAEEQQEGQEPFSPPPEPPLPVQPAPPAMLEQQIVQRERERREQDRNIRKTPALASYKASSGFDVGTGGLPLAVSPPAFTPELAYNDPESGSSGGAGQLATGADTRASTRREEDEEEEEETKLSPKESKKYRKKEEIYEGYLEEYNKLRSERDKYAFKQGLTKAENKKFATISKRMEKKQAQIERYAMKNNIPIRPFIDTPPSVSGGLRGLVKRFSRS